MENLSQAISTKFLSLIQYLDSLKNLNILIDLTKPKTKFN